MSESPFDVVSVIGLGYTGLPTATFLAASGTRVVGVDTDVERVRQINRGVLPFTEPGFEALLHEVVSNGRLSAQSETPQADAYIVAVPTPFDTDHKIDMRYILDAASNIADRLRGSELIVLESTSPPGTTQRMANHVIALRPDLALREGQSNSIYFAHAPERVLPGNIMGEMANNDRVIGGTVPFAAALAERLYKNFSNGEIITTEATTAEMVKLTENTFRDVNIALANELSVICNSLDIDVWELIRIANHHPRVNILQPGPGVGGHCIAVDPWFIVSSAPDDAKLIRAAREVNDAKPSHVVERVLKAVEGIERPTIICLGLTFKADIDDTRQSPSIEVTDKLASALPNAKIFAVEPHLNKLPTALAGHANVALSEADSALAVADIVLLLVDHSNFRDLPPSLLENSKLIDTRGFWTTM